VIDIVGWNGPVMKDDLEMAGKVRVLDFLKACGGDFVSTSGRA
jgi:hypothetical protein